MPSEPPSAERPPGAPAALPEEAAPAGEGQPLSDAQLAAASNVLDALLEADRRAQDPALILAAREAVRAEMRAEEEAARAAAGPSAASRGAPEEPVSPAKEWGAAIVLMVVFALLGGAFLSFLRP